MEVLSLVFTITSIVIILTPGQDMILVMSRSIAQGQDAFSNISNPKITIFYFSYLPQFVVPNGGSETLQLFILGTTFAVVTFMIKGPIGYISGILSFWIKARPVVLKWIHKTSGVILIGLGLKLAFKKRL